MQISISSNAKEIAEALSRRGRNVLGIVEGPIDRGAFRIEAGMKVYPPPPANSRYRRTGTLGRRWTTRPIRTATMVGREVGNNTEYAPLVQSAAVQARVHRGRWLTDEAVIEREAPRIIRDVERTLQEALDEPV
jgi:hypothetical protein